MRRIVLYLGMSLDGFVADRAGGVDWMEGQDPADRRVVHLSLTDGGQALAREGRQVQAACLETLFSGLTAEEAAVFQILLEKVLAAAQTQFQEEADG